LHPLVADLGDIAKTEEAAGIVGLTLRERGFRSGRRGFTSVGSSILERSQLLLGNWLVTDIGVGWGDKGQIPVPNGTTTGVNVPHNRGGGDPGDHPERPGQPNIGCTVGGYPEGVLNRCTARRVCGAFERQRLPDKLFDTGNAVRTIG